ncbi:hypothetical protein BGW39_009974 [Mortierella sp. 14UC]|nr:hypothetical protein BGW39_009974 [Mortierella sp. 14UC]
MTQPHPHNNNTITTHTAATNKRTNRSRTGPKQPTAATSTPLAHPLATPGTALYPSTFQKPLLEDSSSGSTKQQHSVAGSASEFDDGGMNAYLSLVFRRIRKLKKRMTRVKSTEATLSLDPSKKSKLEPGQLVALEKKIEMSAPLKELEDVFKAMSVQQAKEKLEQKKQIEEHLQDIQQAQDTATKETQETTTTALIQVIRLFYALKQLDEAKEYLTSPLLNSFKVLEKFQTRLFEVAQGAELLDGDGCAHSRTELFSMVHKLGEKCSDKVTEDGDITYTLIYDELDHITHPSACPELKDIPLIPDNHQEPNLSIEKDQPGKVDYEDKASVQSLSSEPSSMVAQKSCATVESWFNKLSASATSPSSESPTKSTPGPRVETLQQGMKLEQAERPSVAQVSVCREVASQTGSVASSEQRTSIPAGSPMPPSVVPFVPVHPMPDYRFVLPPWVGGSSYPADPHMAPPPAQRALLSMHASNEPGHPAISQPDDKEDGKGGTRRRFGRSTSGSTQDTPGPQAQRVLQESHGHSGDGRQLGVIYEVEEKDYIGSPNVATHGRYAPYYQGPINQEPEQFQVVEPNQRGVQDCVVASTMAESVSSGFRRGAPSISGDQLRQQGFGRSSATTLQQPESTFFGKNHDTTTATNKRSSPDISNGGGAQARRSGKKKGRNLNRSSQEQTQPAGAKKLDQRSTETLAHLCSDPQQQRSTGNNGQYLQYQQHSVSRPYEDDQCNNAQNQQQHYRYTLHKSQQPLQQQQRRYNEEQELSHHSMQQHQQQQQQQQQQQGVSHFVQQPYYQHPGGWYYPGHGGGRSVYYVQGQQEEHRRQQGSLADEAG